MTLVFINQEKQIRKAFFSENLDKIVLLRRPFADFLKTDVNCFRTLLSLVSAQNRFHGHAMEGKYAKHKQRPQHMHKSHAARAFGLLNSFHFLFRLL